MLAGAALPLIVVLLSGHTLEWRDTPRIHAPLRGLVVDALRSAHLPLWNPYESCGAPLFAQMVHGVLHPVSVAAALLAPRAGSDLQILVHVMLAALGAGFLARRIGASAPAASAAGFAYGLSGYVLSMATVLHYLAAAATAPWVVAALRESRGGRGRFAGGALTVVAAHFAGDPQWTLIAVLLGLALALEAGGWRALRDAIAAAALGTALAGVQLLPAWALLGESVRGTELLSAAERAQWSLVPARLVELVAPGFFSGPPGRLVAPVFVALGQSPVAPGALLPTFTLPFVISAFVGAAVLALAAAGIRTSRASTVLVVAAAILVWMAMGSQLGADALLRGVPLWRSFRYSEKLLGPISLCIAMLAALGLDRVSRSPSKRLAGLAGGFGALAAGVSAWLAATAADATPWRGALASGLLHASASLIVLAVLLAVASSLAPVRARLPAALAGLVFLQSLAASPYALHAGARGMREAAPLAELKGSFDPVRVGTPLRGVSRWKPEDLDAHDAMLAFESRLGVAPFPAASGIDQIDTYTALVPRQASLVNTTLGQDRDNRFWTLRRRFALTHVVIREPLGPRESEKGRAAAEGGRLVARDSKRHFEIYEVPHRAWASFAEGAVYAASDEEVQRALAGLAIGSWSRVVLEGPSPAGFSPGRVLSTERTPERLRIEAESDGPGLLVVNDTFESGWEGRIDGEPVAIQRADGLVRAVPWPAGRHTLEMTYRPASARIGLRTTAVGAIALLALSIGDLTRRRARGARWPGSTR